MQLLMYGDSTFEMLRGSLDGAPNERAEEGPAIFSSYFSSWTAASVFGMAGLTPPSLLSTQVNFPSHISSWTAASVFGMAGLTLPSFPCIKASDKSCHWTLGHGPAIAFPELCSYAHLS